MSKDNVNYEGIEDSNLAQYVEESYLNYALYVIKDRVLPFIGDGLKPVQRRIIYTMSIEGIDSSAKKKKSAFVVGQVLGRFHPHGDSACYQAMVLMTQDFSFRYPLINGQGNFGDIFVPDGFAAMRYTEAFLSPIGKFLTQELHQGGTKYRLNYTGDEKEPEYLPARIPHILLNGISGIAVGMATDIPPHNVGEVIDATIALLDKPTLTVEDLVPHYIKGPDYPTGAEIINSTQELIDMYKSGNGRIRMRATWEYANNKITITSLLPHIAGEIIQNIANHIQNKKLPQIEDIHDESTQYQTSIVLILKGKNNDPEAIMNFLFANTDLERNYTANLNIIGLNGKPEVKSLTKILTEWIQFRKDIVALRYQHRQNNLLVRLNKVKGYLIAFNKLDQVIEIVRFAPNPKEELINKLELNDEQAESILELKVRNLAKLEEDKLINEEKALLDECSAIAAILADPKLLIKQIKKELKEDAKTFSNDRRTQMVERQSINSKELAKTFTVESPAEDITIILSESGYIRCAKGHNINLENMQYRTGDKYQTNIQGRSNQLLVLLDSTGRSYTLDPNTLPNARGYGEPISSKLKLEDKATIIDIILTEPNNKVLLASSGGYGFICNVSDLESRNKNGKAVVNLDGTQLLKPILITDTTLDHVLAITNLGRVLIFELSTLPELSKGKGNKIIDIKDQVGAELTHLELIQTNIKLKVENGKRISKIDNATLLKAKSSRGRKGQQLIRGLSANSKIIIEK